MGTSPDKNICTLFDQRGQPIGAPAESMRGRSQMIEKTGIQYYEKAAFKGVFSAMKIAHLINLFQHRQRVAMPPRTLVIRR